MTRKLIVKRPALRARAKPKIQPNLLDLERPARRDRPMLYWSGLIAAALAHGSLLGYLIGHDRMHADHATGDAKAGRGAATQPLAKGDRESTPPEGAAPAAGPNAAPPPRPLNDGEGVVPPGFLHKQRKLTAEQPLVTADDLIAVVDQRAGDAILKVSLPEETGSRDGLAAKTRPAAVELPGDMTGLWETHLAMAASEEKTSTHEAGDPQNAVSEQEDQAAPPEPASAGAMPDGDAALPEDRGAANIGDPPVPPSADPEAAPPAGEPAIARLMRRDMESGMALPEDRGAADIVALPEPPAPVAETEPPADAPPAPERQAAAAEPSDIPVAGRQSAPETEAPPAEPPAAGLTPAEPVREAAVAGEAAPAPVLNEAGNGGATKRDDPPPAPAVQANLMPPQEPPAQSHVAAEGIDAPNMPLPRRRPILAKAGDEVQTSGSMRPAKPAEAKPSGADAGVEAYRQKIRAHLAEFKPAGGSGGGTVVVTFTLSNSGEISSASILRSSGTPALDESVLAAVRRAVPFPKPPPGTRAVQRRFTVPFLFRS